MQQLTSLLAHLYEGLDPVVLLPELSPHENSAGWTLDCPHCGGHDARIYKTNIGYIECGSMGLCGRSATIYRFLRDKRELTVEDTLKILADSGMHVLDLSAGSLDRLGEEDREIKLLEDIEEFFVTELWSDSGSGLRQHLGETASLSDDEIRDMRLGMFPDREGFMQYLRRNSSYREGDEIRLGLNPDQFGSSHVITIPYRDPVGNIKGFAVLSADPDLKEARRYLWTTRTDTFFNLHEARGKINAIVVDDPLTALTASAKGFREIMATGGNTVSASQIENAISHAVMDFAFCLAGDKGNGDKIAAAIDLMRGNQIGLPFVMELPSAYRNIGDFLRDHTAGELDALFIKTLRESYGVEWMTRRIIGKYPRGKYGEGVQRLAIEEIKAFQDRLTDPADRELVVTVLQKVLRTKTELLRDSIASFNELRHRRQLHEKLQEIAHILGSSSRRNPEEVLGTVFSRLKELSIRLDREKTLYFPQSFQDYLVEEFNNEIGRLQEKPFMGYSLMKFPGIAKAVNGIQPGLYVITGGPGSGKTALMTNLISDLLQNEPTSKTLYGVFEGGKALIRKRLIGIHAGVPMNEMRESQSTGYSYAWRRKAHNQLASYAQQGRLLIEDFSDIMDFDDLQLDIRQRINEDSVLFFDGIQLLPSGDTNPGNGDKAARLRKIADIYRVPLFCSVGVAIPFDTGEITTAAGFDALGHLAHAADVIITIAEDSGSKKDRGPDDPSALSLQFLKNRFTGFTGSIQLELTGATGKMTER